ncbi:MAG: cytidylate kinase family protein [Candidatus Thermoplasmatota archaeon]|jgi:cytidylate kinase|nr:cytidylate kinase family protein [Candidatus Thermoplasmatota archaeon]MDP7265882.1 cytidylate kinase family protein [Candidatus Thermoplasmatota archaeon]
MIALTIGGLSGTGTTTVAKLLEKCLGIEYVYTGDIFRRMAAKMDMTVGEFGYYVSEHTEIDRELDARQVELARGKDIIIEGRLAGYMAFSHEVTAYKIWLHAPPETRAQRVAGREAKNIAAVMEENKKRQDGNRTRYLDIYGFDINDTSFYDIDVDSSIYLPDKIRDMILDDMRSKGLLDGGNGNDQG